MSSRKNEDGWKNETWDAGRAFKEVIIANDALSVIVNPSNKAAKLTREQLEGIFTGKIKNWKRSWRGWYADHCVFTWNQFRNYWILQRNMWWTVKTMQVLYWTYLLQVQSFNPLNQTEGAIVVGLAYLTKDVRMWLFLMIKKICEECFVEAARNKNLPNRSSTLLLLSYIQSRSIKPYLDFVLSPEGQCQ